MIDPEKTAFKASKTDWKRLDSMNEDEIDFSDIPELDEEFFKNAKLIMPVKKQAISFRLDADVLEWFKSQGKEYEAHINAVLRTYVNTQ